MKRLFISYARDDLAFRDSLVAHLEVLRTTGILESWHDGLIAPGQDWKSEVDAALQESDIVVFLVSASFLASRSCQDFELAPALDRWSAKALHLVPVLIRACDWEASPIAGLKMLPTNVTPVAGFAHQDEAWTEVTRAIRAIATGLHPALRARSPLPSSRVPSTSVITAAAHEWDVFICHAHEDKDTVARPLAQMLTAYGLQVWYDEFSLRLGDPLRASLQRGIAASRFGVVILSRAFLAKRWTAVEFEEIVRKRRSDTKHILPLWFQVDEKDVRDFSQELADTYALRVDSATDTLEYVAHQIVREVRPELYGHISRRRSLLRSHAANSGIRPLKTEEVARVHVPDTPVYQEELDPRLVRRIRLVLACVSDVVPGTLEEWIHDFQREPYPYKEISTWEHIAAVYMELTRQFSLRMEHRLRAYVIILENTMFVEDLTERHAPLWRSLPSRVRAFLKERVVHVSPPTIPPDQVDAAGTAQHQIASDGASRRR